MKSTFLINFFLDYGINDMDIIQHDNRDFQNEFLIMK